MTPPVDYATIQKALYTWLNLGLSLPVSWGFQKRAQNNRQGYGVLSILSVGMPPDLVKDEAQQVEIGDELYQRLVGTRRIVLNVQCVTASQLPAEHAVALLSQAQATLRDNATLDEAGITFVSDSPITNLSAVVAEGFESRASFDVTLDVVSDFTSATPTGWFNKAVINGKQIGPP